ncbi:MAG: hypothetical protein ACK4MR_13850, partial [Erythrobacter cryptus]
PVPRGAALAGIAAGSSRACQAQRAPPWARAPCFARRASTPPDVPASCACLRSPCLCGRGARGRIDVDLLAGHRIDGSRADFLTLGVTIRR